MLDFPWIDDADDGYTVEPYTDDDQAPAGTVETCAGVDPDGEAPR